MEVNKRRKKTWFTNIKGLSGQAAGWGNISKVLMTGLLVTFLLLCVIAYPPYPTTTTTVTVVSPTFPDKGVMMMMMIQARSDV